VLVEADYQTGLFSGCAAAAAASSRKIFPFGESAPFQSLLLGLFGPRGWYITSPGFCLAFGYRQNS
jgi:hypothetical protein